MYQIDDPDYTFAVKTAELLVAAAEKYRAGGFSSSEDAAEAMAQVILFQSEYLELGVSRDEEDESWPDDVGPSEMNVINQECLEPSVPKSSDAWVVTLDEIGPNKINVIKAIRELTTLGLREAKELVESAPSIVYGDVDHNRTQAAASALEANGATVSIETVS